MRIPLTLRVIAGLLSAVLLVWAVVFVVQGRYGVSLIAGSVGALCARITFSPMRESAY
jgi:hypothetical protein